MDRMMGEFYTPKDFIELISRLAAPISTKRILGPACGSGELLDAVAGARTAVDTVGVDIREEAFIPARMTPQGSNPIRFVREDFLMCDRSALGLFDLVVCNPPFGMRVDVTIEGVRLRNAEAAFIAKSLTLLNDGGYAIYVVPESVLFNVTLEAFRQHVVRHHSLEAVVSLPAGQFDPYTGMKTSVLIVRRADQRPKVFFAQYLEPQAQSNIIKNYWAESENKNPSQGRWVPLAALDEIGGVWTYSILRTAEEAKRRRQESKYPVVALSVLVRPLSANGVIANPERTLLIQSVGAKPKVYIASDDTQMPTPKSVIRCEVVDDHVMPQFLKLYLNSERGRQQLQALSNGVIPSLRSRDLARVDVEVPDPNTQNRILALHNDILDVQATAYTISQQFLGDVLSVDRFRPKVDRLLKAVDQDAIFESLIAPLATSYRMATKSTLDPSKQLEEYDRVFEFIAVLSATVLLSALPEELRRHEDAKIWTAEKWKYARPAMGHWVGLYRRLATLVMELKSEERDALPFGSEFYADLCHNDILMSVDTATRIRNKVHGSSRPDVVKREFIRELHGPLTAAFRRLLSAYSGLRLVYPTSMTNPEGLYVVRMLVLQGTAYPFEEEDYSSEVDMRTHHLHLLNTATGQHIRLLGELAKLEQCKQCGHWSVFFFKTADKQTAVYRSYQEETHEYPCDPKDPSAPRDRCSPKGVLLSFLEQRSSK